MRHQYFFTVFDFFRSQTVPVRWYKSTNSLNSDNFKTKTSKRSQRPNYRFGTVAVRVSGPYCIGANMLGAIRSNLQLNVEENSVFGYKIKVSKPWKKFVNFEKKRASYNLIGHGASGRELLSRLQARTII
jgi:hypothetical protein